MPALSYQPLTNNCHPLPPTSSHRQAAWRPHGGPPGPGSRAPLSRTTVTSHTQVAAGPGAAPLPATPQPPQTCPEFPPEASRPPCHVSPPRSASARAAPAQHPRRPLRRSSELQSLRRQHIPRERWQRGRLLRPARLPPASPRHTDSARSESRSDTGAEQFPKGSPATAVPAPGRPLAAAAALQVPPWWDPPVRARTGGRAGTGAAQPRCAAPGGRDGLGKCLGGSRRAQVPRGCAVTMGCHKAMPRTAHLRDSHGILPSF